MKKLFFLGVWIITLFSLFACKNNDFTTDDDNYYISGGIIPFKSYSEIFKLDFIAFGGIHLTALDPSNYSDIELTEEDREYLSKPFGRNDLSILTKEDILNLDILDEDQENDFKNYCQQTNADSFKLGFTVSNDETSDDNGKQIIWITNLGSRLSKERVEINYNLFYESKILNFNDILDKAKEVLKLNDFDQVFLNNSITGIYLHNYQRKEDNLVLNFYVLTFDSENKVSLVKFDITL